ncbi:hypothetical protein MPER_04155 [Moniliophthora perniciosa FA553]|nr:hypothetical protein MPER_04155 [Moniliophthora perniciosa FA553]
MLGVLTLLNIHYNLCTGTLATYASDRPDIAALVEKLLRFEISGQYCLTELGHGLHVINMETTVIMLSNGDFFTVYSGFHELPISLLNIPLADSAILQIFIAIIIPVLHLISFLCFSYDLSVSSFIVR